jgi:peptide/nickel transport system ATP-binding protein
VMYAGREAEIGAVDDIFYRPAHPYTRGLLGSLPRLDRRGHGQRLLQIGGQPPSLISVSTGCAFHPRCPYADNELCVSVVPETQALDTGHRSACHYAAALDEPVARV